MADVTLLPASGLHGSIGVPGDKSIAHRALLCGALAHGWTRIAGIPRSADVSATIRALNTCGVQTQRNEDAIIVHGTGRDGWLSGVTIDCANSGTTMRLLMGILASLRAPSLLIGDESLSRRPMQRVAEPLGRMGAAIELRTGGIAPVKIGANGPLHGIDYALPTASAQLKSALLLAALSARGRTTLHGRIDSRDHTERMLPRFGVNIERSAQAITIEGGQRLRGAFIDVPGDPSSAAYLIAAAVLTPQSDVVIPAVGLNQTRIGFIRVLQRMGARIELSTMRTEPEPLGTIRAQSSSLRATVVDSAEIPGMIDELPLLAVAATQAQGETTVCGAAELRVKESDRIAGVAALITAMGGVVDTFDDGFRIGGPQRLRGAVIHANGDHRIAMSAAIAALTAQDETRITGAECVGVSYPGFFTALQRLGATAT